MNVPTAHKGFAQRKQPENVQTNNFFQIRVDLMSPLLLLLLLLPLLMSPLLLLLLVAIPLDSQ